MRFFMSDGKIIPRKDWATYAAYSEPPCLTNRSKNHDKAIFVGAVLIHEPLEPTKQQRKIEL